MQGGLCLESFLTFDHRAVNEIKVTSPTTWEKEYTRKQIYICFLQKRIALKVTTFLLKSHITHLIHSEISFCILFHTFLIELKEEAIYHHVF